MHFNTRKEKLASMKVAAIRIEPYLAQYLKKRYPSDGRNGGMRIKPTTDLYHCVWEHMSLRRADSQDPADANLLISLPNRRALPGQSWKDPAYYNYLSASAARHIEECVRRQFNFELHRVLLENEEFGRDMTTQDVVHEFISRYQLHDLITDDALIKNYQRYRQRIYRKRARKYEKSKKKNNIKDI